MIKIKKKKNLDILLRKQKTDSHKHLFFIKLICHLFLHSEHNTIKNVFAVCLHFLLFT